MKELRAKGARGEQLTPAEQVAKRRLAEQEAEYDKRLNDLGQAIGLSREKE